MPLSLFNSIDLNDTTKVGKFYYTPNSLVGGIGNMRLVVDGGESYIEQELGTPPSNVVGYSSHTAMLAASPAVGTTAYVFDVDPTKHGRYLRQAGPSWSGRLGNIQDKAWPDPNHTKIGGAWLELLLQSWFLPGDAGAPGSKLAFPNVSALSLVGGEIRVLMRVRNCRLGQHAKLVQHMQTKDLQQQNWADPAVQRSFVNAIQIADPISDQLGFGTGGYYETNAVAGVNDSGWVEVVIPLSADASAWHQLGGIEGRQGMPDEPVRYYNYVVAPPSRFLQNFTGNAYMCVAHKVVDGDSKVTPPSDADRIRGTVQYKRWQLWLP